MIIAIDGPAGSGKSTIARRLADTLGFLYIDTGAMYRALTLKILDQGKTAADREAVIALARTSRIILERASGGSLTVMLDGRDVSRQIREPRVTAHVSEVARIPEVRAVLVELQRSLGSRADCVLDGRDIGTVVFPAADRKFFLDARFDQRVERRYRELKGEGLAVTREAVEGDLRNRDTIDSTRACAPLRRADDAVYIDTTDMTIDEVTQRVLSFVS